MHPGREGRRKKGERWLYSVPETHQLLASGKSLVRIAWGHQLERHILQCDPNQAFPVRVLGSEATREQQRAGTTGQKGK